MPFTSMGSPTKPEGAQRGDHEHGACAVRRRSLRCLMFCFRASDERAVAES
jgi:hypothetical protein